ncbi:MAG: polysaccharide biosynthesis C-terminal domain-containing protein, partial [Bdellovibrionales bacterium]|nr:polysaccharide biosynthesis C-terminal domain-containing protein [Bdellovibrionales bacterium]
NIYYIFSHSKYVKFLSSKELVSLISVSAPFLITNLSLYLMLQVDLWVLNFRMSEEVVALYGVAYRLMLLISIPMMILNFVVQPLISDLYVKNELSRLEKVLRASAFVGFSVAGICIFFYLIIGKLLIGFIFKPDYVGAWGLLLVLCLGQLANIFVGSVGYVLMMTGKEITMMYITIFSGLLNLTTSWFLIDFYGAYGAAFGSVLALVVQSVLMWKSVSKSLEIKSTPDFSYFFKIKSISKELLVKK